MSKKKEIIELTPPSCVSEMKELYVSAPYKCAYCNGEGAFYENISRDETDVTLCPICGGKGHLIASVSINWEPQSKAPTIPTAEVKKAVIPENLQFIPTEKLKNYLTNEISWRATLCMNNHLSISDLDNLITDFCKTIADRGETGKTKQDAKTHFSNWLRFEKQKKQKVLPEKITFKNGEIETDRF